MAVNTGGSIPHAVMLQQGIVEGIVDGAKTTGGYSIIWPGRRSPSQSLDNLDCAFVAHTRNRLASCMARGWQ